jgi:N-acetylneuraminic acid mutarotase
MGGSDTPYQGNVYGTKGVSDPSNMPGGRWAARSWTDTKGNLWLFGGHEGQQDLNQGFRNDLWRYTISNNEWTWVSGDNVIDQSAVYGTKGVASVNNKPGARAAGESWNDKHGNLWLFGGGGYVSNVHGWQNDLWKYNITSNEWTWVSGDSVLNALGVYGQKGIASPTNMPGSRVSGVSWTDKKGNFWLFGGLGYASTSELGALNDLWKYNIRTNEWTWIGGDSIINTLGTYGTKGIPSASNNSGGREASTGWTDNDGNFWLFGGYGYTSGYYIGWMNDLWKYEPATNQWTWMTGDDIPNQAGVYGNIGVPASGNNPGARSSATTFVGKKGELWLFSGYVVSDVESGRMNDLWVYDPDTNLWAWMSGEMQGWASGIYGTKGQPAADNTPGSRDEPSSWTDKRGDLWMFGGRYSYSEYGVFNDLWRYQPQTPVPTESSKLELVPNPAQTSFAIIVKEIALYDAQVSIYDNSGTLVLAQSVKKGKDRAVDISMLRPGFYYVRVQMNQQRYYGKLLKE